MNFNRTNHHRSFCAISACLIAIFGLNPSANAGRIYVDGNLTPCGDGIGWGTAYKYLQDALDFASDPENNVDEIWVAAGSYFVDQSCANEAGSGDRTETFQLVKEVFLLGGFNGTETLASQRNPILNETFLVGVVGDLAPFDWCPMIPGDECGTAGNCFEPHGGLGCENSSCCQDVCDLDPACCCDTWDEFCAEAALEICGDAYHVVTAGGEIDDPEKTVIDGFTISEGTATVSLNDRDHGGGMLIKGEPSVVRCTFTNNAATARGGGMSIVGAFNRPWIINCIFEDNPGAQPWTPTDGGGLASFQADAIVTNTLFVGNSATVDGGGIFNNAAECPGPAPLGGACGRITLINCTLYSNTADANDSGSGLGGGIRIGGIGSLETTSSIFWHNTDEDDMGASSQISGPNVAVTYSDVEGGWPGGTNIGLDPAFLAAPGDLRLTIDSPCIDAGNTNELVIPCDFFNLDNDLLDCTPMEDERTPDLDLTNRVLDGDLIGGSRVDMGAYEFIHPDICPWDLNDDCMVGAADLLELLFNWGPCPGCDADFDGDDIVGASDLLALLFNWGPCDPCSVEPLSLEDELALHCLDLADWAIFLDKMQNGTEAEKENHLCWMLHYLEDCSKCFCTGASGCPDDDPFNG